MRVVLWTIREAEPWTAGSIAGGILLLLLMVTLAVWGILVTLRR